MPPLIVPGATYFGGFSHLDLNEPRIGRLIMDDNTVTLNRVQNVKATREYRDIELCRTRAIASMEVTSEQAARSRVGATLIFGVLGLAAKGAMDRATVLVHLRNGDAGYLTINKQSTASLLGVLTPWLREQGIAVGSPEAEPAAPSATAPKLIADELAKLAQLRDSGVLSDNEFVTLKTQLIQNFTGIVGE